MRPEGGDRSEGGHRTWMLDGMFFETQEEPQGLPCPSQGAIAWPHKAWGLVLEAARLREGLSTDVPSGPGTGQGKATRGGATARKSRRNAEATPAWLWPQGLQRRRPRRSACQAPTPSTRGPDFSPATPAHTGRPAWHTGHALRVAMTADRTLTAPGPTGVVTL